ncbi:MAG: 2-amino-4-hydroxy-6-hydroxymethyldihydropteridine diphosphokinase [Anaerolineales bacterium]|nr:2-amino-4-hydroxy-6-hydroxymethyldihydropteridine diphosphokinase [Anaerolineales bacterium]
MADHLVWLLLGSNIDPERNLRSALCAIAERETVLAVSSVWQSPPADGSDQPDYFNAAALIRTAKTPAELFLRLIAPIERRLGRRRGADPFAARTIDIDLSLYDDFLGEAGGKPLPHPDVLKRPYVALPLAEISPDIPHPATGEPLRAIAERLRDGTVRRREDISPLLPPPPLAQPHGAD